MLRTILPIVVLFISFFSLAQPSNDTPCNAINLGTLPTPGACGATTIGLQDGGPVTVNNQTTVGATGASPYVYQTQCSGGGNQTSPALDTWYSFVASGYIANISISGFPNASIALWTGTCNNLSTALGCYNAPNGGAGTLTMNQLIIGQTYWIEISGGTSTATDASFSLSVDNDIDCNDCLISTSLTASPLPVNGGYTAGQVVNFCFTVNGWNEINTNWFHGVQITMASGWTGTISNATPSPQCSYDPPGPGNAGNGTWTFYPSVTSSATGQTFGQGFYFDNANVTGTNAGQNFGDATDGACTWTFCWSLTVGACTPGMSLNVTVNTTGDGESGSWSSLGCADDNSTTFSAIGVCCTPPLISLNSQTICSGSNATLTPTVSPTGGTYAWSNTATSSSITVTPASTTTYSVTYSSGGCSNSASATVTVNPQTTPTFTQVAAICSGGTFSLPTTSNNSITGTWSPAVNNTTTTTYTFTPTAGQCATTTTMTVVVNTPITPTFNQVAAICSGGTFSLPTTSNNSITGTWSPAINNTTTTTYTFTPTAGQCATTTTMTVTVNAQTVPTFTQVSAICSGGSFTLPTTSNNSITGTWSPAINNTTTTTYTFTPTAGQCATTTTMTVTVNAQTVATFTQVSAICSGGSFTLPTTSNNSITGTWSPAINNTTTTTYTFTPTAGQCATTTTMTVTVNAQTVPTFTQVSAICSGGSFTLPTTSNNSITGTWSPAINNTTTSTYTFTPTAGQCATTTTMTVTVNAQTVPTFTQVAAICSGDSFTLPSTSNNAISGTWSPAINNTTTTNYTFTPTAGQCATTTTMTVAVNAQTVPTFTQVAAICSGDSFTLPSTSNNAISGTWSPAINNTTTTTYTFTPTAGQCATTTTMTVTVNAQTVPTFTQVAAICSGDSFTLPSTSNNAISGTWSPAINNTTTTTYTFTPTAGQCATTTTMTVTVNAQTVPTFTQVAAICSGGTFTLPSTSNNSIIGTWSPAIDNTTTTTYTFTPTAGQCATTTTMTVNVGAPVTPTFSQVASICSGSTFTLPTTSNNGYTGTWSPAIDNTTTTTYTFTPTAGQCATTTTMSVTVNTPTTPTFTPIAAICSGDSFTLSSTSNNSISGTWSPAINNTATTTYTFTPNVGECATTTTMTVTVNPQTIPTFTQVAAICSGGTFSLPTTSNNSITGTWSPAINNTATTTYTFTPSIGQCATTTTMTVTVIQPTLPTFTQITPICSGGTFSLSTTSNNSITGTWSPAVNNTTTTTYTFTPDLGLCASNTTMTVTVNSPITPTFNQVAQICSGGSFTLASTSNNAITGTWSPAIDNTTTTTYTFTPGAGQCATTTTMTVNVGSPATPTFTQIAPICSGGSISLPTTSNNSFTGTWSPAINNTATTTYTFTPTAGQCAVSTTMTVTVNAQTVPTFTQVSAICSGGNLILPNTSNNSITGTWSPAINNTATTTYTFTPSVGQCATTATMTVTVNQPVTPTFSQIAAICSGGTFTLPVASNNGINGSWSPLINNTATTTYTFTPTSGQCATTTTMTVTVNQPITPTFTQVAPICSGGTFTLPASANNGISGSWSPAINNSSTTTYTFTPTAGQCATSTTMSVTVNQPVTPTFTQIAAICSGGTFTLPSTSINGIPGTWSPAINNTTTTTYTFTPLTGQCATTTTMSVTVNPIPNLSFIADTLNGCAPLQVTFTNLSNAGNCQYLIGNGVTLTGCTASYIFEEAGCYDITLIAELNGCSSSVTQQNYICIEESPIANFSFTPNIFTEPFENINFNNSTVGAVSYFWQFGDNGTSTDENPNHLYTNTETGYMITLTAYSQFGCSDEIQIPIDYEEVEIFYVPNTFTPDGDNYNQDFHAVFTSGYDPYNFQMLIFDRWGEVIWESHDVSVGWDGTYGNNGRKVPDGVYTWKINFKRQKTDDKRVVVGHVTVIR
jgi:gliding motility-associated-like protein